MNDNKQKLEGYLNEEYLKKEIMEQSRHLFIYGYDNDYRSKFLQNMESDYPVTIDSNKPVALYFNSLGLPKIDTNLKGIDTYLIHSMSREYLYSVILSKILERSMEIDEATLNNRLSRLISLINRVNVNKNNGYKGIETVSDLLKEMNNTKSFYLKNYINYSKGLTKNISVNNISIPFLQLGIFVSEYKEAMNIDSHIGIIFDKKSPLAISSTQAINSLINGRINKDISVKVVIEPNNWDSYRTTNGRFIEDIHDYGTVELDDSYEKHIKTIKRQL